MEADSGSAGEIDYYSANIEKQYRFFPGKHNTPRGSFFWVAAVQFQLTQCAGYRLKISAGRARLSGQ